METIKSVVGLGSKEPQGEEPVSGEKGEGTTAEPYDAGNSEEAQEAAKAQPEQHEPHTKDPDETKNTSTGSWLTSAIPFVGSKKQEDNQDTSAGAAKETVDSTPPVVSDEANRPPNHLGVDVPSGHSIDFAPPQPPQLSSTEQQKMASNDNDASTTAGESARMAAESSIASSSKAPSSPATERSPSASSGVPYHKLRGSRASMSAPSGQRPFNPAGQGRIPTAGGVPLGQGAAERRRSMWSSTGSGEMPALDKAGSPDPVTQNNTFANTAPQSSNGEGSSKAAAAAAAAAEQKEPAPVEPAPAAKKEGKPDLSNFGWDEGGEGAAEAKANGTTTTQPESNGGKASAAVADAKEKVKENTPTTSTSGAAAEKKERRGSRLGGLKEKLKIGKK